MKVRSGDSLRRDAVTKRREYAEAGIPEYWTVDPQERRITVLTFRNGQYEVHIEAAAGQQAESVLLPGFRVAVDVVLAAAAGR